MSHEVVSLIPGLLVGLALGVAWRWAGERRERRSRDAALMLDRLARTERELSRAMALRGALLLGEGDAGEWWRPATELAAGLHDAAGVCGDPRLAELPDPVHVEEVVRAAARSREALRAEVRSPAPPPEGIVLVRRSAGIPASARRGRVGRPGSPPSTTKARTRRAS